MTFLFHRFTLDLKRRSQFYVLNIILPCVMLSVLQLCVFLVPPPCGEKVSLSITVLLSFTVFLLMVSDNMPQTSISVPILGEYLFFTVFLLRVSDNMPQTSISVPILGEYLFFTVFLLRVSDNRPRTSISVPILGEYLQPDECNT